MCKSIRSVLIIASIAVAGLWASPSARAWNDTGHMVTGMIAWDHLDSRIRAQAVAILAEHPRFSQDFLEEMPDEVRAAEPETQALWMFCHATTWPDIARGFGGGLREAFHRSTWHYINDVTFLSEADRKFFAGRDLVNDSVVWFPDMPADSLNIVQALKMAEATLRDSSARAEERALALTWVFHLVGDLHQPLHSTALYSKDAFPTGDRGGNGIPTTTRGNLHAYWDGQFGNDDSLEGVREAVDRAAARVVPLEAWSDLAYTAWFAESVEAVRIHTYTDDVLYIIRSEEARLAARGQVSDGRPDLPRFDPSGAYEENARAVAEQRIMAAGVRLAHLLESILGPGKD
jgi:hypothetical protein